MKRVQLNDAELDIIHTCLEDNKHWYDSDSLIQVHRKAWLSLLEKLEFQDIEKLMKKAKRKRHEGS